MSVQPIRNKSYLGISDSGGNIWLRALSGAPPSSLGNVNDYCIDFTIGRCWRKTDAVTWVIAYEPSGGGGGGLTHPQVLQRGLGC
jgi:hypothetical protein